MGNVLVAYMFTSDYTIFCDDKLLDVHDVPYKRWDTDDISIIDDIITYLKSHNIRYDRNSIMERLDYLVYCDISIFEEIVNNILRNYKIKKIIKSC